MKNSPELSTLSAVPRNGKVDSHVTLKQIPAMKTSIYNSWESGHHSIDLENQIFLWCISMGYKFYG
jgi:hypothetical protein